MVEQNGIDHNIGGGLRGDKWTGTASRARASVGMTPAPYLNRLSHPVPHAWELQDTFCPHPCGVLFIARLICFYFAFFVGMWRLHSHSIRGNVGSVLAVL